MADDCVLRLKEKREKFAELKNTALAELERKGYEIRGKTPAQIRQILRRRPSKLKSEGRGAALK